MRTYVVSASWLRRSVMLSGTFREEDHPRDKAGRFIDADKIEAAKTDAGVADELRDQVRPKDAGKLERAIGGGSGKADAEHFGAKLKEHTGQDWDGKKPLSHMVSSFEGGIKRELGEDADTDGILHYAANIAAGIAKRNADLKGTFALEHLMNNAVARAVEHEQKAQRTQDFADTYFDQDDTDDRVDSFLEHFVIGKASDHLSLDDLDADTQAAVMEDLANWQADTQTKANTFSAVLDQYGLDSDEPIVAAVRASMLANAPPPTPFNADEPDDYAVIDLSGLDPAQLKNAEAFMAATGASALAMKPGVYVTPYSGEQPVDELMANNEVRGSGISSDNVFPLDETGRAEMFERIKSPRSIGEHQAPASSKNMGTVSGSTTGTNEIEAGWNPQNVDVYRRLNRDTYMVRLARNSPEASDAGDRYAFVKASDVPVQVRLPDQYWAADASAEYDDIDHDAAEVEQKKDSGEATEERRSLEEAMKEYGKRKKLAAPMKARHEDLKKQVKEHKRHVKESEELYSDYQDKTEQDLDDASPEHNEAMEALDGHLVSLNDEMIQEFEVPKFSLQLAPPVEFEKDGRKKTDKVKRFATREDHIDHLNTAVEEFDGDVDQMDEDLSAVEQGFEDHYDNVAGHWADIEAAARKVMATGVGSDSEQVRDNARFAARLVVAAKRHQRNRGRKADA